jgi:hypothetical protein
LTVPRHRQGALPDGASEKRVPRSAGNSHRGRNMVELDRRQVNSDTFRSIGYDQASRIMEVEFADGVVFRYFQVPEGIHKRLMRSRSKSSFFRNYIHYQYWCSPQLR